MAKFLVTCSTLSHFQNENVAQAYISYIRGYHNIYNQLQLLTYNTSSTNPTYLGNQNGITIHKVFTVLSIKQPSDYIVFVWDLAGGFALVESCNFQLTFHNSIICTQYFPIYSSVSDNILCFNTTLYKIVRTELESNITIQDAITGVTSKILDSSIIRRHPTLQITSV